jgi:FdhD protein
MLMHEPTQEILYRPEMTDAGLDASSPVSAVDEYCKIRTSYIAAERPLTLYLDKREIVTVMTLGTQPELLILGWLRNQHMVSDIKDIKSIQVDWETDSVAVTTHRPADNIEEKLDKRTITTGCGQGTVFGALMENIEKIRLPETNIKQSTIYDLLKNLNEYNEIYKRAGAVHGCALCRQSSILDFVEDVGRHNAVDAIAGSMWLNRIDGNDKLFYTTGRLTSEMVIKVAQMGIPVLLSRSGVTQMGRELARKVGVTLIARAKGRHFLIYNGAEYIQFDAMTRADSSRSPVTSVQQIST